MAMANEGAVAGAIAGRYERGAERWRADSGALTEGLDLLVGRPVLLETVTGPNAATATLEHVGLPAPQRTGRWGGEAVVVHPFVPAAPLLPDDDEAAAAQLDALVAALATLAATGTVHGGILPESLATDGGRLTSVGATLASAGAAMPYSSPNVRQGRRPTSADDAWSVAALLGALLTGASAATADPSLLLTAARARPALLPAVTTLLGMANPPNVLPLRTHASHRRRVVVAAAAVALVGASTAAALGTGLIGPGSGSPTVQQAGPVVGARPVPGSSTTATTSSIPTEIVVEPPAVAVPPADTPPVTIPPAEPPASTTVQLPLVPLPVGLPVNVPATPVPTPTVPGTPNTPITQPIVVPPSEPTAPAPAHHVADDDDGHDHGTGDDDRDGEQHDGDHHDGEHRGGGRHEDRHPDRDC
jgi:hypothetical protein